RFEPTPSGSSGDAGQATASAPAYSFPPPGIVVPTPQPTSSALTPGATGPSATPSGGGLGGRLRRIGGSGGTGQQAPASLPVALLIIVVLAAAAVTPRAVRSLTRRRRWFRADD